MLVLAAHGYDLEGSSRFGRVLSWFWIELVESCLGFGGSLVGFGRSLIHCE